LKESGGSVSINPCPGFRGRKIKKEEMMKKRMRKYLVTVIALAFSATMLAGPALKEAAAQEKYPSRAIEYIVPWGPGGGADQLARKSGVLMEKVLNVPFPVIDVPSGSAASMTSP
jgi:hypothetical protein